MKKYSFKFLILYFFSLYESLKLSIQSLQKSKYGKGNKKKLSAIMHALNRANSIFNLDKQNQTNPESIKQISFRNVSSEEQVPRILDEFMDDFEKECLEKDNGNAKNYSLFSVTSYKIIRTLDSGKRRGLLSAHALNRLNKAIDIEKNLSIPYEFDQTILDQMMPLLQRYYVQYDDTVRTILEEFSSMPKFKLVIEIGEKHKELIEKFLDYSIARLPLETRIKKAKSILEKIIAEEVDSVALGYYENLKLTFSDETLRPHLSKIAKEMPKTNRRFANTILEEVSAL
jgi:hypothetical protein